MKHKHHIIPKHAGGTDDTDNIIELTVEEHAEAHRVLYEKYGRHQDWLAWQGLAGLMTKEEIIKHQLSMAGKRGGSAGKGVTGNRANGAKANWAKNRDKIIEVLRENSKKYSHLAGCKSGKWIWINDGNEAKKVLVSDEIPAGWSRGRLPMSDEVKKKIKLSSNGINKGIIRTPDQRKQMSERVSGTKWFHNPMTNESSQFANGDKIPEGWIQGRGKINKRKKGQRGH